MGLQPFSHEIAENIYSRDGTKNPSLIPCADFGDITAALINTTVEAVGVFPTENSHHTYVQPANHEIMRGNLEVLLAAKLNLNWVLGGLQEAEESGVETVFSHAQGIGQNPGYIKRKGFKTRTVSSTSAAAKLVKESNDPTIAALCSPRGARAFDLKILNTERTDEPDNATDFLVLGRMPEGGLRLALAFRKIPKALEVVKATILVDTERAKRNAFMLSMSGVVEQDIECTALGHCSLGKGMQRQLVEVEGNHSKIRNFLMYQAPELRKYATITPLGVYPVGETYDCAD